MNVSISGAYSLTMIGTRYPIKMPRFTINDFSMIIEKPDMSYKIDLSNVLKLFLANQFNEEYTDYLYKKRIEDATEEKKILIENSPQLMEDYRLTNLIIQPSEQVEESGYQKSKGSIN